MDSITSSIKFLEDEVSSIGSDNPCLIDQQELRKEELRKEQSKQKMNFINQCYSDLNNLKQPSSRTSTPPVSDSTENDNDINQPKSVKGSLNYIYELSQTPCDCICKCSEKNQIRVEGSDTCRRCHFPFFIMVCNCQKSKNLKRLKLFCEKRRSVVAKFKKLKLLHNYDKRRMGDPCNVAKHIISKYPELAHLIPVYNRGFGDCLYNAISRICAGDYSLSLELRLAVCIILVLCFDSIDEELRSKRQMVFPKDRKYNTEHDESLTQILERAARQGGYAGKFEISAISRVINGPISVLWPSPYGESDKRIKLFGGDYGDIKKADEFRAVKLIWYSTSFVNFEKKSSQQKKYDLQEGKLNSMYDSDHFAPLLQSIKAPKLDTSSKSKKKKVKFSPEVESESSEEEENDTEGEDTANLERSNDEEESDGTEGENSDDKLDEDSDRETDIQLDSTVDEVNNQLSDSSIQMRRKKKVKKRSRKRLSSSSHNSSSESSSSSSSDESHDEEELPKWIGNMKTMTRPPKIFEACTKENVEILESVPKGIKQDISFIVQTPFEGEFEKPWCDRGTYGNYTTRWPVYELNGTEISTRPDLKFITEIIQNGEKEKLKLEEQFIATVPIEIQGKKPNKAIQAEFASKPEKWRIPEEQIKDLVVFKVCYMDHSVVKNAYQRRCTFFRLVPTALQFLQNMIYVQVNVMTGFIYIFNIKLMIILS